MERDKIDMNDVVAFVRVVEFAGFSAAARQLGVPKSTLSRRVARLEADLALQLLHRTSRTLRLTDAGVEFHERAALALRAMREATSTAAGRHERPRGTLRIAAPSDVGAEVLPAMLARFVARYPETRVEVELTSKTAGMVEGGYDLALRGGRQRDSSLVMRKLQDMPFRLFASPAYLAREGRPRRVEDLTKHACILARTRRATAPWILHSGKREVEVTVGGKIAADDLSFVRRAAVEGAGIAALPEIVGLGLVGAGILESVLPDYHAAGHTLYMVYPATPHLPLKVAALRDFLLEQFAELAARAVRIDT